MVCFCNSYLQLFGKALTNGCCTISVSDSCIKEETFYRGCTLLRKLSVNLSRDVTSTVQTWTWIVDTSQLHCSTTNSVLHVCDSEGQLQTTYLLCWDYYHLDLPLASEGFQSGFQTSDFIWFQVLWLHYWHTLDFCCISPVYTMTLSLCLVSALARKGLTESTAHLR